MDREDLKYVEQGVLSTSEELNEATVVDKIKLNQNQDRRVKLTQEQKEQIRDLYNGGGHSLNSLAKQFGVSKKTILLIVNPESKAKNDEYIKNHWKDYYDKEEHTQAMKNTRNYKRDLLDKGEIGNQVELNEKQSANGYQPQKVGKAYKVFRVKNGKLYPPMVANQGGKDTPIGVWLDAEEGEFAGLSKTGRPQVKSTGSGNLAYRPGWHLGDIPRAKQFDRLNKETGEYEFPKDFVWAECDYAMDVDYQPEADEQGYMRTKKDEQGNVTTYRGDKYQHSLAGLKKLPTNRYYKYRTNPNPDTVPWVITGQMKVNRLLSDDEVNEILKQNGIEPIHRQGGDKTLKELGLNESLNEVELPTLKETLSQEEKDKLEKIDSLINDIYLLRQKSIQEEGEFGIGNLVFKEFRNMGYLDHLKEFKRQLLSKDLSLESLE